mgnify:CR=1 FL=1
MHCRPAGAGERLGVTDGLGERLGDALRLGVTDALDVTDRLGDRVGVRVGVAVAVLLGSGCTSGLNSPSHAAPCSGTMPPSKHSDPASACCVVVRVPPTHQKNDRLH